MLHANETASPPEQRPARIEAVALARTPRLRRLIVRQFRFRLVQLFLHTLCGRFDS